MRNAKYTPFNKPSRKFRDIFSIFTIDRSENVSVLTWKRIVYIGINVVLLLVIQEAVFNDLRLFNAKPNFALVFVFTISVLIDTRSAIFVGLFTGMYIDINYGRYIGVYALQLMLFAALISVIGPELIKPKPLWSVSLAVPSFFIYTVFESFVAKLLTLSKTGGTVLYTDYGAHLLRRILPITLYDTIVFLILFVPVRLIWGKLGPKYQLF